MLSRVLRDVARAALLVSIVACSSSRIDRDGFESSTFCADDRARVEAVRTKLQSDDLSTVLGPIDSPEKVYVVMRLRGYEIDCDRWFRTTPDGFEAIGKIMTSDCDPIIEEEQRVAVHHDGTISVLEREELSHEDGVCVGRRPSGLVERTLAPGGASRGAWFARAAQLESASVDAFRILARELAAYGAPRELVREAERSACDEIRHTTMMVQLAVRFGARFDPPVVEPRPFPRSLFEIARENAIEGCVRETYGAVEAIILAEVETDPAIARVLEVIARDEVRHAELAWSIAAWTRTKLDDAELREIDWAMKKAASDLGQEVSEDRPRALALAFLERRVWTLQNESRPG
jgi:hypothetical protein